MIPHLSHLLLNDLRINMSGFNKLHLGSEKLQKIK